jgi:hypothetical protein
VPFLAERQPRCEFDLGSPARVRWKLDFAGRGEAPVTIPSRGIAGRAAHGLSRLSLGPLLAFVAMAALYGLR